MALLDSAAQDTFEHNAKDSVAESNTARILPVGLFEIVMASIP